MTRQFTIFLFAILFGSATYSQNCNNYFIYQQNDILKFTFRGFMENPSQALYTWDFGDGNTAQGKEVSHNFDNAGDYLVCLTTETYDSLGNPCIDTSCQNITAGNPPGCIAFFFGTPSPSSPQTWIFSDFSSGTPTSFYWDFGDGTTSSLQDPIHAFVNPGTYNVCLTITDTIAGCDDTYCEEISVALDPGDCESDFTYSSADLLTFDFEGYMIDPSQTDVDYAWDFGDGNTGNGQYVIYTYAPLPPTYYTVCLTTTLSYPTGDSCVFESCSEVFAGSTTNCQAMFNWSFGSQPLSINFIDISTGQPSLWEWDFGDSTYSTEQNPTHIYNREGLYDVCLTITNETNGCTSTLCSEINVSNAPPPVNCSNTIETTQGSDIYSFSFHGEAFSGTTNISENSTFRWNFGDGTTVNGQDADHTYAAPGSYQVRLGTVSILNGTDTCTAYSYDSIHISDQSFCIGGSVFLLSQIPADLGLVQLISHDPANHTIISTSTATINNDGSYLFEGININDDLDLYLQAGLSQQSAGFGQYAPTYHTNVINWGDAQLAVPEECPATISHDIMMHSFTAVTAGDGTIAGVVYNGNTREVMENVEILLLNESRETEGYTYSDVNGFFEFSSIAYGTYYIYPEIVGIETDGFMVTIGEDIPEKELNIVIVDGAAVLSVEEYSLISILDGLYPNPARELINITISAEKETDVQLSVYNQLGQQMKIQNERLAKGVNTVALRIAELPESIYYLRLQAGNSKPVMRSFVKSVGR